MMVNEQATGCQRLSQGLLQQVVGVAADTTLFFNDKANL